MLQSGTVRDVLKLAPGDEPNEQVDPPDQNERSCGRRHVLQPPVPPDPPLFPLLKTHPEGRGEDELFVDSDDHGERLLSCK